MMKLALALIVILTITTTAIAEKPCLPIFEGSPITDCIDPNGVVIIFKECPKIINNMDGTYSRDCESTDSCFGHKELWSNYPENKGTFIRRVE